MYKCPEHVLTTDLIPGTYLNRELWLLVFGRFRCVTHTKLLYELRKLTSHIDCFFYFYFYSAFLSLTVVVTVTCMNEQVVLEHCLKCLILCTMDKITAQRCEMTWGGVNNNRIYSFTKLTLLRFSSPFLPYPRFCLRFSISLCGLCGMKFVWMLNICWWVWCRTLG